ncbi:MAG: DUF4190 domain-containing protein [Phycisphaerae bacterium]|nr:DUF4190 domain-containing protein [Phycisphaerae bacterium]
MNADPGRYTLRRGEHSFGPYTLNEVAAYLATGNLIPQDALFDHETQRWSTVEAVLKQHGIEPPAAVIPPPLESAGAADPASVLSGAAAVPGRASPGGFASAEVGVAPGMVAPGSRQGMAIAALVLGISSFALCCGIFTGIPAIVLGVMAMKDPVHRGMGIAGLVLGILSIFTSLVYFVFQVVRI